MSGTSFAVPAISSTKSFGSEVEVVWQREFLERGARCLPAVERGICTYEGGTRGAETTPRDGLTRIAHDTDSGRAAGDT